MVPMKIKRPIFNKLWTEIKEPEISILLGARQVGKTTLMHQIESRAEKEGHDAAFFNLESSEDLEKLSGPNKDVVDTICRSGDVIFIDEFHYLKNASKIFKEIYDSKKNIKIYASGSSSLEIHKHLKESLAGRFRKTIIYPLSFNESRQKLNMSLNDFLRWGGLPGLIHRKNNDEKMDLLSNIVSTYIIKDIKALIKEENVRAFNSMLYSLAQNQGSLTVVANIAKEAGLSESTVANYLEIMSQTYVCYQIHSYSTNLANELKKSKKCYLFDAGIRNILLKDFRKYSRREDKGSIFEAFVLHELVQQLKPNTDIRFWRTKKGAEVDFIYIVDRQPFPIEIKSKLKDSKIPSGLLSFVKKYKNVTAGFIFNETINKTVVHDNRKFHFITLENVVNLKKYL